MRVAALSMLGLVTVCGGGAAAADGGDAWSSAARPSDPCHESCWVDALSCFRPTGACSSCGEDRSWRCIRWEDGSRMEHRRFAVELWRKSLFGAGGVPCADRTVQGAGYIVTCSGAAVVEAMSVGGSAIGVVCPDGRRERYAGPLADAFASRTGLPHGTTYEPPGSRCLLPDAGTPER